MVYINDIHARQILDSRGNPTLEVMLNYLMEVLVEQPSHQELQQENTKLMS